MHNAAFDSHRWAARMSWWNDAGAVSFLLWRLEIVWSLLLSLSVSLSLPLSFSISHTVILPLSSLHPLSAWSAGPAGGVSECCEWVAMVDWTAILRCEHHSSWIRRVLRHPAWMALSSSPCLLIRCNMEDVLKIRMGILRKGFLWVWKLKIWESHKNPCAGFRNCSSKSLLFDCYKTKYVSAAISDDASLKPTFDNCRMYVFSVLAKWFAISPKVML